MKRGHEPLSEVKDMLQDLPGPAEDELVPGISIIVPAYLAVDHIAACLESVAAQTLDHDLWELIVVCNGRDDGTHAMVGEFTAAHPGVVVRRIRFPRAGVSHARNLGLVAARRSTVTFLDADDRLAPGFLESLWQDHDDGIVPLAHVVDVHPDGVTAAGYMESVLSRHEGRYVTSPSIEVATAYNAAKLIPTTWARQVGYATDVGSGEDVVFMTTLFVLMDPLFKVGIASEDAAYLRTVRADSLSRRQPSFEFSVTERLEVMQRLAPLRTIGDPDVSRLVQSRMQAQATHMRAYRRFALAEQDMDATTAIVDELDRRSIAEFPYAHLNAGLAEDLAVAYGFPPTSDTSAVVAAKRVRQLGRIVDVVTNPMPALRHTDPSLRHIAGPFLDTVMKVNSPQAFSDWGSMCQFTELGLERVLARRPHPYRTVYSRAHFAASHLLAARYVLERPETRWVAEFSDPLSRDIFGDMRTSPITDDSMLRPIQRALDSRGFRELRSNSAMEWCEWMAYGLAEQLIFTNEVQRDYMLSLIPDRALQARARKIAEVRPHPTLPAQFYSMVESDYPIDAGVVNIAYFGNFYATRGLAGVLAGLATNRRGGNSRVNLHVFTSNSDEMRVQAATAGVSDQVHANPYVPYLEFLNLTRRFDALLVNDAATRDSHEANPFLPSKLSDYRGSGVGVWAIVEPGSPLSQHPVTWTSTLGDEDDIAKTLDRIVQDVSVRR